MMKKPGLALVIAAGKPEAKNDDEKVAKGEASEDYEVAVDELADTLGVPESKRADFADAFMAAVAACK